jgi:hypothetical protein
MSISKYVTALTLTTSLLGGCAPSAPKDLLSAEQQIRGNGGWDAGNSAQAVGGDILGVPIKGLVLNPTGVAPSPSGWWLRSQTQTAHAPVLSITLNGQTVDALTAPQGWFVATVGDEVRTVQTGDVLELQIGAPLAATLRLQSSDNEEAFGRYTAEYQASGQSEWNTFCPHMVGTSDGEMISQAESVIPVGGAYWHNSGARVDHSSSIQLSCTHDSIGACITWGYAPWTSVTAYTGTPPKLTTTSLKDTHQACTRMKRNDVCGDGNPVTTMDQNSYMHTIIQVWDYHGIHSIGPQTASTMEAFWGTGGATCYNPSEFRAAGQSSYDLHLNYQLSQCPKSACNLSQPGLLGSARPCLATDPITGACTQN